MSTGSAGLLGLPDEVLLMTINRVVQLARYEHSHEIVDDRVSKVEEPLWLSLLSRTCKHLHALVTPILYRSYHTPENSRWYEETDWDESFVQHNYNLRLFLRTLLARPCLANQVQALDIKPAAQSMPHPSAELNYTPPENALEDLYRATLPNALESEIYTELFDSLLKGDEEAEIALLVALTPNIKTMSLHTYPLSMGSVTRPLTFVLRHITSAAHESETEAAWRRQRRELLEHVDISVVTNESLWSDEEDLSFQDLAEISSLLPLPHISTLKLKGLFFASTADWRCLPRMSKLQTLVMPDAEIPVEAMKELLASCAHLRVVNIKVEPVPHTNKGSNTVSGLLESHKSSLEDLSIQLARSDPSWHLHPDGISTIGNLGEFTKLRRLSTSDRAILAGLSVEDVQAPGFLPPNIEHFTLSIEDNSPVGTIFVQEALQALLRVAPSLYPHLRTIKTDVWFDMHRCRKSPCPQLIEISKQKTAFEAANITWLVGDTRMNGLDPASLGWLCRDTPAPENLYR